MIAWPNAGRPRFKSFIEAIKTCNDKKHIIELQWKRTNPCSGSQALKYIGRKFRDWLTTDIHNDFFLSSLTSFAELFSVIELSIHAFTQARMSNKDDVIGISEILTGFTYYCYHESLISVENWLDLSLWYSKSACTMSLSNPACWAKYPYLIWLFLPKLLTLKLFYRQFLLD